MGTEDIRQTFDILQAIRGLSSTKAKQEELAKGKDNRVLRLMLLLTYSPFTQFYIKKIPPVTCSGKSITIDVCQKFFNLCYIFSKRKITGNAAITALQEVLSLCTQEEFDWYTKVIQKDLKCGIAEKSINKVFPSLIPTYEVLLADKFEQEDVELNTPKALSLLPETFIIEPKLDGMRLNIWVFPDGRVELYSRNGKLLYGFNKLEQDAHNLPSGYVYDGELMSVEFEKTLEKAEKGIKFDHPESDCYQDLMTSAFAKTNNKEGIYNLFDRIPIDEFINNKATETLWQRKHWISEVLAANKKFDCIKVVPWSEVLYRDNKNDRAKAVELMHKYLSLGYEGAMVKDWNAPYEFKRSKVLLKMKLMDLLDMPVIDIYPGAKGSKYENSMGGVTCEYEGYPVGVGSGWSDEERDYYWKHPEEIIGKVISVSYQNISENLSGEKSLRFPVKKVIRYDKE